MKNPLISIIIPVYNVEPYLHRCIDSVLAQTYQNIEVILVDDGSPDNCPAICDEYAAKDSRVLVIHKENGGVSSARNAGLDVAKGDYIGFVDSDDWIEPDLCEVLYNLIVENDVDISVVSFQRDDGERKKIRKKINSNKKGILLNSEVPFTTKVKLLTYFFGERAFMFAQRIADKKHDQILIK